MRREKKDRKQDNKNMEMKRVKSDSSAMKKIDRTIEAKKSEKWKEKQNSCLFKKKKQSRKKKRREMA